MLNFVAEEFVSNREGKGTSLVTLTETTSWGDASVGTRRNRDRKLGINESLPLSRNNFLFCTMVYMSPRFQE